MIIYQPKTTLEPVDIGPLDATRRLPMSLRHSGRIKSVCPICSKSILDDYAIAGFKKGHPNMLFHESCFQSQTDIDDD